MCVEGSGLEGGVVSHSQEELVSKGRAHSWQKAKTGEAARGVWKLGEVGDTEKSLNLSPAMAPHQTPRRGERCVPGESDALRGSPPASTPSSAYE